MVKAEWICSIQLSRTREVKIHSNFSCDVSFHYPQTLKHFNDLMEDFKLELIEYTDFINSNKYRENKKTDSLIVMGDVSALADLSNKFASFLMITRKFSYHCVCIFHIILPEKRIVSQTNTFNIFPASVPFHTIMKVLQDNLVEAQQDI